MSEAQEPTAPACPVPPYGYHGPPPVKRDDAVLTEPSLVRLPARCITLERELEDSGRVEDFVRQLWVIERAGRPGTGLILGALLAVGGIAAMVLAGADAIAGWQLGVGMGAAVLAGLIAERIAVRTHRARLRRVHAWREYVGFQA